MDSTASPLMTRPKSVALIGMGPSFHEYFLYAFKKKNLFRVDEIWGVNSTLGAIRADKTFIMDDLKGIEKRYPEWSDRLKLAQEPIITCRSYPDYPNAHAYPLLEVMQGGFGNPKMALADGYFLSTPAYAVGYAIATGVQEMWLFGCDYSYPGSSGVEAGAQNVAFLLGIAKSRGLNYRIPGSSTLLDANLVRQDKDPATGATIVRYPLYGYDFNPGEANQRVQRGQATADDVLIAQRRPQSIQQPKEGDTNVR